MTCTDKDITTSAWYKNIASRKRTYPVRTRKNNNTPLTPRTLGKTSTIIPHEVIEYSTICETAATPIPSKSSNLTNTRGHTVSPKQAASYTLTNFPFLSRKSSTMTILSKELTAKPPSSSTLAAIARSISEHVTGSKPIEQSHATLHKPTWTTVQKIQRSASKFHNIPKTIPPPPSITVEEYATKICTPIVLRIPHPNSPHAGTFDKRRILLALLHAFQQVDPTANIHPTLTSEDLQNQNGTLCKSEDIPTTDNDLHRYLEIPSSTNSDSFHARILLNSNIALHQFKRDTKFVSWLKLEQLHIERSPLQQTMKPHQAGFFTHLVPRMDQTELYEHRAQLAVTSECPPFFLQIKYVTSGHTTTKVWNVYTDANNINTVTQELKKAFNLPEFRQFYAWKEYQSLQNSQKTTILQLQNQFLTEYRSLLITGFHPSDTGNNTMWDDDLDIIETVNTNGNSTGNWTFTDNNDDELMHDESIEDRFYNGMNLKSTTITEFIQKSFISGDDTPVFAHVYEPILGTREVLVEKHHLPEAIDLIKLIKFDICRIMNHKAIISSITHYDDIILGTTIHEPWKSFDIQHKIPKTHNISNHKHPQKDNKPKLRRHKVSYANILIPSPNSNQTNPDFDSVQTPTATSTITTSSSLQPYPETSNTPTRPQPDVTHAQTHFDEIQQSIVQLRESITYITNQVSSNQQSQELAMEQLELRTASKIDQNTNAQKQQIQEIGNSFLVQMKNEQNSTSQLLREMLTDREMKMEQKMDDGFKALILQLNSNCTSPTRKKQAIDSETALDHKHLEGDSDIMTENMDIVNMPPTTTQNIQNPYAKSSLRRRSVNALPTMSP
jgi:hypothetical protein